MVMKRQNIIKKEVFLTINGINPQTPRIGIEKKIPTNTLIQESLCVEAKTDKDKIRKEEVKNESLDFSFHN